MSFDAEPDALVETLEQQPIHNTVSVMVAPPAISGLIPDDGFAKSFCARLEWQRIVVRITIKIGICLSITVAATRCAASR
jgi:hypothetical protein